MGSDKRCFYRNALFKDFKARFCLWWISFLFFFFFCSWVLRGDLEHKVVTLLALPLGCYMKSKSWKWESLSHVQLFATPWTVCSQPGSSVHGILQTRIMERVAISFPRGSSWPKNWIWVSLITGKFFTVGATREALTWVAVNSEWNLIYVMENDQQSPEFTVTLPSVCCVGGSRLDRDSAYRPSSPSSPLEWGEAFDLLLQMKYQDWLLPGI